MQLHVSYSYSTNNGNQHGFGSYIFSGSAPKSSDDIADIRSMIEREHDAGTVVVIITWHELKG